MDTAQGSPEIGKWEHPATVQCMGQLETCSIATGCDDGIVRLWDLREGTATRGCVIGAHSVRVRGLDVFLDNGLTYIATAASNGELCN